MKILFIGDVVGEPGRRVVAGLLPQLRQELNLDFVVANAENACSTGGGLKPAQVKELLGLGVDVLTTGDHLWDQKDIHGVLDQETRLLRPLNYPPGISGRGSVIVERQGRQLAVINLQGRVFMKLPLENPFLAGRAEAGRLRDRTRCILVDMHAETTSEKLAMGRHLDGHVSAVIGTHTHVQTADEQIFPGGTAFLCDAGMTGPHDSILGRDKEAVIKRFLTSMPQRLPVVTGDLRLHGALIEINETTGRAVAIARISRRLEEEPEIAGAFRKSFGEKGEIGRAHV